MNEQEQDMKYHMEEDILALTLHENLSRTYNLDERLVEFASFDN
jgi:hypothetical protein